MTLEEAIAACIAEKRGNKEFILSFDGKEWYAGIGNDCSYVPLGEVSAQIESWGSEDAIDAVIGLLVNIRAENKKPAGNLEDATAKYGILAYDPPPLTEDEVEAKYGGSILDRAA